MKMTNNNWATPPDFLEKVRKEYGEYFDPCPWNHDLRLWDGLEIDWKEFNFVNPPYETSLMTKFVQKGVYETLNGCLSLFLLPVSTSTKLFHNWILPNNRRIEFLQGRLKFIGVNDKGQCVNYDLIQTVTTETIIFEDKEIPKFIRASGRQDLMTVLI
jgi:hypothetical protein